MSTDQKAVPTNYADLPALPLLEEGCRMLGLTLTPRQIEQFAIYYRALVAWNERFNLTAITDLENVQTKHFLDSLAGWPPTAGEIGAQANAPTRQLHLVDVGTGAGFPGVPLKILLPDLKLTLVDGTGKKVLFLNQLVADLGLQQVAVVQGRAEELGQQDAFRERFDLVTARAVAPLNTLVEYLLPLVRPNGFAVIYKGANVAQEFIDARKAIEVLGGETARMAPLKVPFLEEGRFLLLVRKLHATARQYPRGQGLARTKPLA